MLITPENRTTALFFYCHGNLLLQIIDNYGTLITITQVGEHGVFLDIICFLTNEENI